MDHSKRWANRIFSLRALSAKDFDHRFATDVAEVLEGSVKSLSGKGGAIDSNVLSARESLSVTSCPDD